MKLELTEAEVNWLLDTIERMNERREFAKGSTGRNVLLKMRRMFQVLR